ENLSRLRNRQLIAEINPESLNTRQSDLKKEMSDLIAKRSEYFDIYFSGVEVDLESYWGKPAYWLPAWVHAEVLDDMFPPTSDELCFIGRKWRRDDFFFQDKKGIISLYNTEPKDCSLENLFELSKLINRFKILLNPISSITTAMTGKTFEYLACKRMCLCYLNESWMFKSKELFEDGKDIVFFKTFEELEDKYNYYIKNEKNRAKIALAGYKNVRRFHNADLRAIRLANIVLHHANGGKFMPEFNEISRFNNTKESKLFPVS
ncbi:MAG: glycosyltransferase family protein, partial [Nitrospinales bacterium]